jgi:carboxypeptidase C (cathepsin A)
MVPMKSSYIGRIVALAVFAGLILFQSGQLLAQGRTDSSASKTPIELMPPSQTDHSITIDGTTIEYTAKVGHMVQKDDDDNILGYIFYTAYTKKDRDAASQPLTFCFNGGPGSASIYLHMLTIGPQKAVLLDDGNTPGPPPQLEDNLHTWLAFTDLVFIDPIGTGFSFPHPGADTKKFWGAVPDVQSVGEFIRMYLNESDRWLSPMFVAGESYGGVRGALLAEELQSNRKIKLNLNGIIFISPVYDFISFGEHARNPVYLSQFVQTNATTAWHHNKLDASLQADFDGFLQEVTSWANGEYLLALMKGDRISDSEKRSVAQQMARYTGLSEQFIMLKNLRVTGSEFREELLRDQDISLDRLDARFETGAYELTTTLSPAFNHYVRNVLGYDTMEPYVVSGRVRPWSWGDDGPSPFSVVGNLARVMENNKHMKVYVTAGYYDYACPFATIDYALDQLLLKPELRDNVVRSYFHTGHMVYTPQSELPRFTQEVRQFVLDASGSPEQQ